MAVDGDLFRRLGLARDLLCDAGEEAPDLHALARIYVLDQEGARAFYVDKLGFDARADMTMGQFRWLTVGPKAQPALQSGNWFSLVERPR